MRKWRRRCVSDLAGRVIEIGFGAGRNLEFYPDTVTEVVAIEPSEKMRSRGSQRIGASTISVTFAGLDGQHLDLGNDEFDAAVTTFSLCTIPDPLLALRELRRVVRPGGELRILEHGLAPDKSVRRWQHRLNGFEQRIADGCQLVRNPVSMVEQTGWNITSVVQGYEPGPKPWAYFTCLSAV